MGDPSRTKISGRRDQNWPTSSANSSGGSMEDCEGDQLLDAAYALAEFSQLAHRTEEGCLLRQWGWKRKRRRRRRSFKASAKVQTSTSQPTHAVKEEWDPVAESSPSSPTSQEAARACTADKEETDCRPSNTHHYVQLKNVKLEPIYARPNLELNASTVLAYQHGNRLRQPATEIEKEARRLRRVQANRESARQTIRRKQALREELSQKAVQLAHENETMKQQTELVMQEYNSLKDRNEQLKEQISSTLRDQACETPGHSEVSQDQILKLPSRQIPILCHNEIHFPPFPWPTSFIQASTATQVFARENREAAIPLENNHLLTAMASSVWINPFGNSHWHSPPFFLPYTPSFSLGVQPSASHATELPAVSSASCTSSACQRGPSTHVRADGDNTSTSSSADLGTSSQNEILRQSYIDRPLQKSILKPQSYILGRVVSQLPVTTPSSSTTLSNREESVQDGLPCNKSALNQMGSRHWGLQSKELSNPQTFPSTPNMDENLYLVKRLAGAAAASEARKRRKELTRNKNIQARQLKLHC